MFPPEGVKSNMTIGEKIKVRRRELHMTTEDLGKMIGVQRSAVTKYEKGRVELKASQIQAIAKALGVSPVDLLDDNDQELQDQELRLLTAYRHASDEIRDAALAMLEDSAARNRKTPANVEIAM